MMEGCSEEGKETESERGREKIDEKCNEYGEGKRRKRMERQRRDVN